MTIFKANIYIFAAAVSLAPVTASAVDYASAHEGLPPLMRALDTDKNGILDRNEISAAVKVMKKLDSNRDGRLTSTEVASNGAHKENARLLKYMMKRDKNDDGRLTKKELGQRFDEMFKQVDKNQDGFLTKVEILKSVDKFTSKPVGAVFGEKDGF